MSIHIEAKTASVTIKTPAQIADEIAADWTEDGITRDADHRLAIAAIEADRAQRVEIHQDWRDDQENVRGAEVIEVEVRVFGEDRTAFFITDFELTEAQAVGMFQGIGEASL